MMLNKIFHMNQSVEETMRRLGNVSSYRHHLEGVERAEVGNEGTSQWRLQLPLGFRAEFTLSEMVTDDNAVVFRSLGGDLEIVGMMTFTRVKSNLTEINLTLNYESNSPLFNMLDRMLNVGDQFVVNQLRRVRAHFEGIAAPAPRTADAYRTQFKPVAA